MAVYSNSSVRRPLCMLMVTDSLFTVQTHDMNNHGSLRAQASMEIPVHHNKVASTLCILTQMDQSIPLFLCMQGLQRMQIESAKST